MQITRAVITAAGRGARQYPASDTVQKAMLPLVDRDGVSKPLLQIIAEEALESGIEEICVVSAPGDEAYYRHHFRSFAANLRRSYPGAPWAEDQARRLVVRGFFNEIIAKIAVPEVRERLTDAIERELAITESKATQP